MQLMVPPPPRLWWRRSRRGRRVSLAVALMTSVVLTTALAARVTARPTAPIAPSTPSATTPAPPDEVAADSHVHLDVIGAVAGIHLGFAAWTYFAWYANQTQSEHLIFRDEGWFGADTYAGGADKFGHFTANYILTRGTAQLLEAGGMELAPRLLLANALTMMSFFIVELKDGFHAGFGFSWGDIISNLAGNLVGTTMEVWPALDRWIDIRWRYVPSRDYLGALADESTNAGEDYTGMRFAIYLKGSAIDWPVATSPGLKLLRYINVGVGYRAVGFKPVRRDRRTQTVSLRVAFDVQVALNDFLYRGRRGGNQGLVHFGTEVLTLPLTSWGARLYRLRSEDAP